ncbi:hypothetical protein [Paenibacillus sp. YIM B09110]
MERTVRIEQVAMDGIASPGHEVILHPNGQVDAYWTIIIMNRLRSIIQ